MMARLGATGQALVAVCLVVAARPSAVAPTTTDLLDRYLGGDFEGVVAALAAFESFGNFAKDLEAQGIGWIEAAPPDMRARRRLAATTVALEASRLGQSKEWKMTRQVPGTGTVLFWQPPAAILEWACGVWRRNAAPTETERLWQLASIAVAERAGDFEFLVGDTTTPSYYFSTPIDHAVHLEARFPNEPRIKLALGIAEEWHDQRRAREVFEALREDPDAGGEATMRLGAMAVRRGAADEALSLFERVESRTRDPWVVYLSRFLRGRAFELRDRSAEAERAYRSALEAVPRAQSGSIALATLLFRAGRRAEPSALIDEMLQGIPVDPWRGYGDADDRFWPDLIDRLRAEIHP